MREAKKKMVLETGYNFVFVVVVVVLGVVALIQVGERVHHRCAAEKEKELAGFSIKLFQAYGEDGQPGKFLPLPLEDLKGQQVICMAFRGEYVIQFRHPDSDIVQSFCGWRPGRGPELPPPGVVPRTPLHPLEPPPAAPRQQNPGI